MEFKSDWFRLFFSIFIVNLLRKDHFILCGTISSRTVQNDTALLVVSYDAFRPDYFDRNASPFMNRLRKEATSAEFMYNVFPTKTFVNHHTISTGYYPQSHGVLANEVYDEVEGLLGYSKKLFQYDKSIMPIWIANEKSGKHSGCMMWPASDFDFNGTSCTHTVRFNESESWYSRVDTAMSWFSHKTKPANLVMLYIEQPDSFGHIYSPESEIITDMISKLDNLTKYIQQKLIDFKLDKRVNVIHLSDHGMNSVTPPNFIDLTKYLTNGTYEMYGSSPVLQIVPKTRDLENEIYKKLSKASTDNGHFKVYNRKNLPNRWMANNPRRTGPILAVADVKYAFQDMFESAAYYEKAFNVTMTPTTKYGVHGYDNEEKSMHAIFMAIGPLFATYQKLPSFNTVDLYNLFCIILQINCDLNQGANRTDVWKLLLTNNDLLNITVNKSVMDNSKQSGKIHADMTSFRDTLSRRVSEKLLAFIAISLMLLMIISAIGYIFYSHKRKTKLTYIDEAEISKGLLEVELLLNSESDA